MLQQDAPDDYVVAMGVSHSVQELVELAFAHVGLDWRAHVRQDPAFLRPAEVDLLIGDAAKARRVLQWEPEVDFNGLIAMMVDADLERLTAARARPRCRGVSPRAGADGARVPCTRLDLERARPARGLSRHARPAARSPGAVRAHPRRGARRDRARLRQPALHHGPGGRGASSARWRRCSA